MRISNVFLFFCLLMAFLSVTKVVSGTDRIVNSDIILSGFETMVMEQGKHNVRPEFRVKNTGGRTYVKVKIIYDQPTGLDRFGKKKYVYFERSLFNYTSLEPGEEKTLHGYMTLKTSLKQKEITYASKCWFEFADNEGNLYRSPNHKLKEFVRVIPYREDIVLLDYRPVELERGQDKVYPELRVKNRGKETYTAVLLKFDKPLGKYETGRLDSLYIYTYRSRKLSLKPGEEVTLDPARHPATYIKARNSQALGNYSVKYWFFFVDSRGCEYVSPKKEIKEFARVKRRKKDF